MTVRLTWKRVIAALVGLGLAGLLFAWSGLFQIAASSGHWAITDWFLHWTMQNSARTYSAFQTPDKVIDENGLVSAAGHFHQSCEVCHGAPGVRPSPAMQKATPPAPDLADTVGHYDDAELFWIVQHGVKYTGMPAWPSQNRPDEVRRMVGLLRRLPDMTAERYLELTTAPKPAAMPGFSRATLASCTGCHGSDGLGRGQPDIPVIAGQRRDYLIRALRAYATGRRASGPMQVAAAALDEREIALLADHFAGLPGLEDKPLPTAHPIIANGLPENQLPACTSCHGPGKTAPILTGQRRTYLVDRLTNWQGDKTVIDVHKPQAPMPVLARRIPEDEIAALAQALSANAPRNERDISER